MTITGGIYNHAHVELIVLERDGSQNIENNTSIVDWRLIGYLDTTDSSFWYSNYYHNISVSINESVVYSRSSDVKQLVSIGTTDTQSNPKIIASGSATITHEMDGTKTVSCSFAMAHKYNAQAVWSGNGSVSLERIPRATIASVNKTSVTLGENVIISLPKNSPDFWHKIYYSVQSQGNYSPWEFIANESGTSYTFENSLELARKSPNMQNMIVWFEVHTFDSENVLIGRSQAWYRAFIPATMKPTVTDITFETAGTQPAELSGLYVQGKTRVKLRIDGTGTYGSTISKYYTMVGVNAGWKESQELNVLLNDTGTQYVCGLVSDSRGVQSDIVYANPQSILVHPYSNPTITSVDAYRSNADGVRNSKGNYLTVKITGALSSIQNKNKKILKLYTKTANATSYTVTDVELTSYSFNELAKTIPITNARYTGYITLQDSYSTIRYDFPDVPTTEGFIRIKINSDGSKTGIAIGKEWEKDGVDIGWDTFFRKNAIFETGYSAGTPVDRRADTYGKWKNVASIRIKQAKADSPIEFTVSMVGLKKLLRITITFDSESAQNSIDPSIGFFTINSNQINARLRKTSASNWELWLESINAYDVTEILDLKVSRDMLGKIELTYPNTHRNSAPAGTITNPIVEA